MWSGVAASRRGRRLTWFEVERGEGLRVEEVEGGSHREQHVVVVSLVQDDENQIAYLETEPPPVPKRKISSD